MGWAYVLASVPLGAISIEQREAEEFDAEEVATHMAETGAVGSEETPAQSPPGGCPGTAAKMQNLLPIAEGLAAQSSTANSSAPTSSRLSHWPVQLALVSANTPFLKGADLLLVADCVPFAMPDFHQKLLDGHVVVVGCPKLDDTEAYVEKMASIVVHSQPRSLTIVHMEVPCCAGLCRIVKKAIDGVQHDLPVKDITISTTGAVLASRTW